MHEIPVALRDRLPRVRRLANRDGPVRSDLLAVDPVALHLFPEGLATDAEALRRLADCAVHLPKGGDQIRALRALQVLAEGARGGWALSDALRLLDREQVGRTEHGTCGQRHCASQHVVQLASIARPRVRV